MIRDGVSKEIPNAIRASIYAQLIAAELALVIVDAMDDVAVTAVAEVVDLGNPAERRAEVLAGLSEMTLGLALSECAGDMLEAHSKSDVRDDPSSV